MAEPDPSAGPRPELDLPALNAWYATVDPDAGPFTDAALISGGRSNLTYRLVDERGGQVCLRRTPPSEQRRTVRREYELLRALTGQAVPVPAPLVLCDDATVLGSPFFLMEFLDGVVCGTEHDASRLAPAARATVGGEMVRALAHIHAVDPGRVAQVIRNRPVSYAERQIDVFTRQTRGHTMRAGPVIEQLGARLLAAMPTPAGAAGLVHGDFKIGNCMFGDDGRLRAVLDWELATLGEPLADLGWLVASWQSPDDRVPRIAAPPTWAGGFGSAAELVDTYVEHRGADVAALPYYVALAEWKWACIDVGTRSRYLRGEIGTAVNINVLDEEIDDRLRRAARHLDQM